MTAEDEGRSLKASSPAPDSGKAITISSPNNNNGATETIIRVLKKSKNNSKRNLEGYVEAFRPTAPGHSPGVGHSINN
ncbi:hypothetical protein PIB30_064841 [Stylosanthes scabra]|uniref:Uncharacterized protein n=1 Tax=Stylosanthes scabra TaxID=79078 RepID=A0ABU6SM60_9FABA|nr:hypothetical protein [Stylosanthes scabra]